MTVVKQSGVHDKTETPKHFTVKPKAMLTSRLFSVMVSLYKQNWILSFTRRDWQRVSKQRIF